MNKHTHTHTLIQMNISLNEANSICEWLGELFLPSLSAKIKQDAQFNKMHDFFLVRISQPCCKKEYDYDDIFVDIANYFEVCHQIEANLYYAFWLFNLFKPLLLTIIITVFVLPFTLFVFIYGCSLFVFFSKHWNKLKVKIKFLYLF